MAKTKKKKINIQQDTDFIDEPTNEFKFGQRILQILNKTKPKKKRCELLPGKVMSARPTNKMSPKIESFNFPLKNNSFWSIS